MSGPTAAEILTRIPSGLADCQVSDVHIETLSTKIRVWEDFASNLGLSEPEQEEIRRNNENNYRAQKREALRLWREKNGRQATYRRLIVLFCSLQHNNLADSVRRLLVDHRQEQWYDALETFRKYLVGCYVQTPHPSEREWPLSTAAYVDLPLFEAPLEEQLMPAGQREPQPRKRVELSRIFLAGKQKAERKVVLVEGVAGCGKTTLLWHVSQDWAEGRLFQHLSLVIRLSLVDPDISSARCLADLIPHSNQETREAVANAIGEKDGKGVCFLLDGWDEAPLATQNRASFLYRLIEGRSGRTMLPKISIIITTRPGASSLLNTLVTSKVEIGRMDKLRINDIIDASLPPEDSEELQRLFRQRQQLASLCNLPINAAIAVFLFRMGLRSLPETCTGLFKALVGNLLIRHMQLRTSHRIQEVKEFDDLPQDMREKFNFLSSLAFSGIIDHKRVFDTRTLKGVSLGSSVDTLGLMESRQHLTMFGPSNNYSFLHYAVQEFLAAWHISRLGSDREQADAVSKVLYDTPLSLVIPFYAGLTRLTCRPIQDILLKVTKHSLDVHSVVANRPQTESADRRRLALALLNSVYESQDPTICRHVKPPLPPAHDDLPSGMCMICFSHLGLQPSDCLSVGYLIANQSCCAIDLTNCFIGDAGFEALMNYLKQPSDCAAVSTSST